MIKTPDGQVLVTNDGATILKNIGAMHPAARMVRFCLYFEDHNTTMLMLFSPSLSNSARLKMWLQATAPPVSLCSLVLY